jgi:hypothetical protein
MSVKQLQLLYLEKISLGEVPADEKPASVTLSIRKEGHDRRILFRYRPGRHVVNWMVWTDKGVYFMHRKSFLKWG